MAIDYIEKILQDDDIQSLLKKSNQEYYYRALSYGEFLCDSHEVEVLCRIAFLLLGASMGEGAKKEWAEYAYKLLRNIQIADPESKAIFNKIFGYDLIDSSLLYFFYLSSLALKLDKTISARLDLKEYQCEEINEEVWGSRVLTGLLKSLFFLIRKSNGFEDIRRALEEISKLQQEQKNFEKDYLDKFTYQEQTIEALRLVGLYHTSKALTETADYLIDGYNYKKRIETVVRQHIDIALDLVPKDDRIRDFIFIIYKDLLLIIQNCIWNGTAFQDTIKKLCVFKSEHHILELLPSQRQAMKQNLFDVFANAIVVQMPTSAGKTLLAEFNIVLTKSLRSDAKIVYIVPSRALVNQVYFDLRSDLSVVGLNVERTSAATEIDPTEGDFLISEDVDVIVSTPEKMDLLIRRSHPSVDDVALFVIDEAHTIENGQRGARLELLVSMLRRERPTAKFMLLSPFLPGRMEALTEWLGGGNMVNVDWRPSEKIVFGLNVTKRNISYTLLPSAYNAELYQEECTEISNSYHLVSTTKKDHILEYACRHFSAKGKTELILCKGKKSANDTAEKIYGWIDNSVHNDEVELVQKYIDDELGCRTSFSKFLEKGIAVHHAGLSDEVKILTEHLIRKGLVNYVCATTTIAEGVNFPVSSVYFDTYWRGNKLLSTNDFWNIAGRAGRTMVDDFGKIILPFNSTENIRHAKEILSKGAEELSSVLAELFVERENVLRKLSEERGIESLLSMYTDAFAPIFQYFVHLLNVSENDYSLDMNDLFKDSLCYYMLESEAQKEQFIDLCKQIYTTIKLRFSNNVGALKLADKTGFSVPSVLRVMQQKAEVPSIADLRTWQTDVMFDRNNPVNLANKVMVISQLRETGLGTDDKTAPFNPELVARLIISWVKGDKIDTISRIHPHFSGKGNTEVRLAEFITYMNQLRFKASWGLSALEGIVRGNENEMKDSYIPSYVYYGVDNNHALAMRMLGIPRSLSSSLCRIIDRPISEYSFSKLRAKINSLTLANWDELKPAHSSLSGEEWKRIVDLLMK